MKKILISTIFLLVTSSFGADWRIGLGGVYGLYQPNNEKDITQPGGYLTFNVRDFTDRLFFSTGFDFAVGKSKRENDKREPFAIGNYHLKAGLNIVPQSVQTKIFVNLVYSWDVDFEANVAKKFQSGLHLGGADIYVFTKGNKTTYEYGLGYHYVFHGYHYLDKIRSSINDYSYAVKVSFGYTHEITPKLAYFINAKANYYALAASNFNTPTFNRPKTEHTVAKLEIGLQF